MSLKGRLHAGIKFISIIISVVAGPLAFWRLAVEGCGPDLLAWAVFLISIRSYIKAVIEDPERTELKVLLGFMGAAFAYEVAYCFFLCAAFLLGAPLDPCPDMFAKMMNFSSKDALLLYAASADKYYLLLY